MNSRTFEQLAEQLTGELAKESSFAVESDAQDRQISEQLLALAKNVYGVAVVESKAPGVGDLRGIKPLAEYVIKLCKMPNMINKKVSHGIEKQVSQLFAPLSNAQPANRNNRPTVGLFPQQRAGKRAAVPPGSEGTPSASCCVIL